MFIETLTTIKSNGQFYPAGRQYFCPDEEAFRLITSGMAKPANRSSIKQFEQMKAAAPAPVAEGPDIRDQLCFTPVQSQVIGGSFRANS
jgi:hypothetical protein